jgi:integrase/recombinase XerD
MPSKLSTTISRIGAIPNPTNSTLVGEFHGYMKTNGASERHQNNSLKMVISYANYLGKGVKFYDIKTKERVITFLNTKVKSSEEDPDKRWITTWNYYLVHIKRFFRWLHNDKCKSNISEDTSESEWTTPSFINIWMKFHCYINNGKDRQTMTMYMQQCYF